MSVRKAAEEWGVPPSTIQSRIKKGVRPKGEYEATVLQKLSPTQEKHLAAWITIQEDLGVPVSHRQIRLFADRILQANGSSETVGNGWLPRFFKRHPEVKTKKEIYIPGTATTMRRLLVVDGHGSHESDEFMWECYANNVHLLFSPPHCSHVLQPLDLTVFSPLKNSYRRYLSDIILQRNGLPLNKQDFIVAYARAREDLMYSKNVRSGWEASGLWPLNIEKPLASRFVDLLYEVSPELREIFRTDNTVKISFDKIAKLVVEKTMEVLNLQLKLEAAEAQLERVRPKKKRKVKLDPNAKFATMVDIIKAKFEAGELVETSDALTDVVLQGHLQDFSEYMD
ncbi:hypothetical protein CHGG_06981 [Chaetomium globosum CBS 148.51]|uniref:HTH CENPB-type domain-containing protein n=1 Tax=Chaetomium globosum (strain ATCC 6205 / CBS 148.51 / DSM 1962 / NBRC 6347 / NRRL 1970) TaxID=306901 RepID=Q2GYH3_CHAGB|nr:uncharacterized protein CHGG_06981 [Chaetomium globosum CBS 148.51]EAQ85728.1 hypothetical protein CHGG_06981 [Chaetomium globosum CBS 148.51]